VRRREFITLLGGTTVAWPLPAGAQQRAMPVIGILDSDVTNAVTAFRSGLNDTGYVEGQDVAIELRSTANNERLPALAAELVQKHVAVIAAIGGPSAPAAKAATATIPIVFSIGGDPVELGLVSSLNRPGGNITGVTFLSAQLYQKQLGLLREVVPKASVLGVLINLENPRGKADVKLLQTDARGLSLETHVVNVGTESDLDAAFANLAQKRVDALIIAGDPFLLRASVSIAALATRYAIPAVFGWRVFAQAGGLMTYGASLEDAYRQAGLYVGRILRGARPGDLPVMQPTKFDFVINLKAAKALGLTIPSGLLAIADEVIE
jgi:putative ABC transport system substrate-binding protein